MQTAVANTNTNGNGNANASASADESARTSADVNYLLLLLHMFGNLFYFLRVRSFEAFFASQRTTMSNDDDVAKRNYKI